MGALASRPLAVQHCLANNWLPGTVLKSSKWKQLRRLHGALRKEDTHIRVRILNEDGAMGREEFLMTLPEDVHAVG